MSHSLAPIRRASALGDSPPKQAARLILLVVACVLLPACAAEPSSEDEVAASDSADAEDGASAADAESADDAAITPTDTSLTWRYAWTSDANDVALDGSQTVTLETGWFVNHTLQLVPCVTEKAGTSATSATNPQRRTAFDGPLELFSHASDTTNETTWSGYIEDLANRGENEDFHWLSGDVEYCRVFYLAARADDSVPELPAGVAIDRQTLLLSFQHQAEDGSTEMLEITSANASGVFFDLPEPVRDGRHHIITVRRDLAAAFQSLTFAPWSNASAELAFMSSLVHDAIFELETSP